MFIKKGNSLSNIFLIKFRIQFFFFSSNLNRTIHLLTNENIYYYSFKKLKKGWREKTRKLKKTRKKRKERKKYNHELNNEEKSHL